MFTAKDALYEAMAYTDKKTGGSPTPTPTDNKFVITLQSIEPVGDSQNETYIYSDGDMVVDKEADEIMSAYEQGKRIVLYVNIPKFIEYDSQDVGITNTYIELNDVLYTDSYSTFIFNYIRSHGNASMTFQFGVGHYYLGYTIHGIISSFD